MRTWSLTGPAGLTVQSLAGGSHSRLISLPEDPFLRNPELRAPLPVTESQENDWHNGKALRDSPSPQEAFGKGRVTGRKREIFQVLLYFPRQLQQPGLGQPTPEARNSIWIFHE